MKFAKLFKVGKDDQVLVIRTATPDGRPMITTMISVGSEVAQYPMVLEKEDVEDFGGIEAIQNLFDYAFDNFSVKQAKDAYNQLLKELEAT